MSKIYNYSFLKSFLIWWLIIPQILVVCGCSPKHIPIKEEIIYTYKDSTVINTIDSIKIIPVERVVDVVAQYDTLKLETTLAKSTAYVDTVNHILRGEIANKNTFSQHIKYEWKEHVEYKDSLVYEPQPYPVEVKVKNKTNGFLLGWFIASVLAIVAFILKKLRLF